MSQRRHIQALDPSGQFMPGEPGGFVLPLPSYSVGNASRSAAACCPSPMGFVIPDVAAQHQQTWSHAHMNPQAMPNGSSPGGFVMPGAAPAYHQYQQPQQQYSPPSNYLQQQNIRPDLNASRVSFQQQQQRPPSYAASSEDASDSVPDGPAPSRYNSRRHRPHTVTFQLAPEAGGSRSIYPPSPEYQPSQVPGYTNQQQYADYYQQQQNHSTYGWDGHRYNY
ncbi:hypothetical protein FB639_001131 [Coemansia asiatica]|nr:hypothetical protein FB639_001131 [Coemansia asiatica]